MKKNTRRRSLIPILILVLLAAGSVAVAWFTKHSQNTPDPSQTDAVSAIPSELSEFTELFADSDLTDPEDSDITLTGSRSEAGTETETNVTDTGSVTETFTESTPTSTATISTSTLPVSGEAPPVDNTPKKVAFTFDDGPYTAVTKGIADEFAKYGGHCTYFVIGNRVRGEWQETMKYVADLGNEIGIHAYTHTQYYNECSDDVYQYELQATADVIFNTIGKTPTLMRPVGGSITSDRVTGCPYSVILWNVDTKDWKYKKESQENVDIIVQNILSTVTDGDIILMHDIYNNSYEAIKTVLPILKEQGYEFVTVSELLGDGIQTGKKYSKAY